MKKIISILFLVAFVAFATIAQSGSAVKMAVAAGDTITNTGTASKIIKVTGGYSTLSIQPIITNVSGTGAGTVTIYGSNDGVNYLALGDTLGARNTTTTTKLFKYDLPEYTYYKVTFTGSGTMVSRWAVWYALRRQMVLISTP